MAQTLRASAAVLAVLLGVLLATATAVAGEGVVGTATLDLQDKATGRSVTTELWFRAVPNAKVEWFSPRPPLRSIPIARHADPQLPPRKQPLIVISHGNWGGRYAQGWLALALVKAGYVVLSPSHPGAVGDDQTVAGRYRLWDRSRDVSFALDEVLTHAKWAALIDENRIGFAGHSFGGWTGVSLAGGRYDANRQRAFCADARRKDFYCDVVLKDDVVAVPSNDAGDSFRDGRIKAFYIMGSGPGQGFVPGSLAQIDVPFVVDTAKFDEILDPAANSTNLARQIPSAREVMRPVGHFAYVPACRWLVGPILAKFADLPFCDDPSGLDRTLVHKQVASDVVAFFDKTFAKED